MSSRGRVRPLLLALSLLSLLQVALCQSTCKSPGSNDARAVMIGQSVCYTCPQGSSDIQWGYRGASANAEPGFTSYPNGSLHIASVMRENIGFTLTCAVSATPSNRFTFELSEAFISDPTVADQVQNETNDFSYRCNANANPFPHTFRWLVDGNVVSTSSILSIDGILRNQTGVYVCETINDFGSTSANITVTVQYQPSATITVPTPIHWMRNHTLSCAFDGVPTPSVAWSVNSTEIQSENDNYVIRSMGASSFLDIVGTRLDNSGDYSCSASNLIGSTSDSGQLTVQVPPDAPTGITASGVTIGGLTLTWSTNFDGNSPITGAVVLYQPSADGGSPVQASADQTTSHALTGLQANTMYTATVRLVNTVGESQGTQFQQTTVSKPPLAPGALTVVASSSTALQVSWQLPASDPERAAVTSWQLQYREQVAPTYTTVEVSDPAATQYILPDLKKGTTYVVRLRAVNSGGQGPLTSEQSRRTDVDTPSQPTDVITTELNAMLVRLRWTPSSDSGGSPLFMYRVELKNVTAGGATFMSVGTVDHPTLEYTVMDLSPEISYQVQVAARNMENLQYGAASPVLSFTTPKLNYPPTPGVQPNFSNLTDTSVLIHIPVLTGIITNYTVEYKLERVSWDAALSREFPYGQNAVRLTGLEPGSPYQVRFYTRNNLGRSVESPVLAFQTGPTLAIVMSPNATIAPGDTVTLECTLAADSSRTPSGVVWLKDGSPIDAQDLSISLNAHTLTITKATIVHNGVYLCRHTVNDAVVSSETRVNIVESTVASTLPLLTQTHIIIIAVSCAAGCGLLLLIVILCAIIVCYKCRSGSSEGNYKISNSKNKANWIEVSGENDTGMVYMSSHYPTVRSQDSRAQIEGTPFDYQPPEEVDHPFSTFNTMEKSHHLRAGSSDPHGYTPEPPLLVPGANNNPMHVVSLDGLNGNIVEDTV